MPTYDYQCKECGYTFEEFQSMNAELLVTCPSCGKPALKRLMAGGAGMIFKGSGFYHTDYKTAKPASKESESKPASKSSESSKTEKKSDSPPSDKSTDK
jgi:putative FmdB family regulatory protein